jgi:hypothetical protein
MTEDRPTEPSPDDTTAIPTPAAPADPASVPPAYTPPAYTPPPIAPPQPAVAWAPPPAVPAKEGQRTTLSLAAGILLVMLGALGVLASLAVLTIGRAVVQQYDFSSIPGFDVRDPNGVVGAAITFGGIFVLACSTFYIVGGVGIMRSKNWGRIIGIIIGILASLLWLGSVMSVGRSGRAGGDPIFALVLLGLHAYIAIALLFFWRSRSPAGP